MISYIHLVNHTVKGVGWLMPDPISWTLIGICLFLAFFFSASETALACTNRFRMQIKADDGSRAAKTVLKVIDHYDRALTAVLIGHNIVCIAISSLSTILFVKYLTGTSMENYASLFSSLIMAFVVYIFGDALSKTIAKAIPDTFSLISVYPVYGLMYLFFPITLAFEGLTKIINKIFKNKSEEEITEEDFENIVEKVSDEGLFEEEQSEIIQSALEFSDTKVKEVFTPIEKVFAIDIKGLTHEKLGEILLKTRYSRIPVYKGDYQHFIGVLHVKIYLEAYIKNSNVSIRSTLVKPYYVSQNVMIDDLFNGFKKHHSHLALVTNSNKRVIGMVTMEDVLEELVSDISEPSMMKGGKN